MIGISADSSSTEGRGYGIEHSRYLRKEVVSTCRQFRGGLGHIRQTAVERLWRDARVLAIGGGATEVMLEEVAKRY